MEKHNKQHRNKSEKTKRWKNTTNSIETNLKKKLKDGKTQHRDTEKTNINQFKCRENTIQHRNINLNQK